MMIRFKNIDDIDLNSNNKILVDTNVWLFINGPENFEDYRDLSSTMLELYNNGVKLFVNQAILSEYVNRCMRSYYRVYSQKNNLNIAGLPYKGYYKRGNRITGYRETDDFKEKYNVTISNVNEDILGFSKIVGSSEKCVKKSIREYRYLDFNDEQIVQDAIDNDLSIWTQDSDYKFVEHDVNVLQKMK